MSYPDNMLELIKKVEATRPKRIEQAQKGENFAALNLEEGEKLLHEFHPDYKDGTKRKLKVGKSKDALVPNEVADLLEAEPCISLEDIDLEKIDHDVDVLVIGGGGAGASAALTAQKEGAKVLIVTKLRLGDANTMMAEGGIQAADKENDSPSLHFLDAIGGGHFTNEHQLLATMAHDAPATIQWLAGI
jgi:hypothetical protein